MRRMRSYCVSESTRKYAGFSRQHIAYPDHTENSGYAFISNLIVVWVARAAFNAFSAYPVFAAVNDHLVLRIGLCFHLFWRRFYETKRHCVLCDILLCIFCCNSLSPGLLIFFQRESRWIVIRKCTIIQCIKSCGNKKVKRQMSPICFFLSFRIGRAAEIWIHVF